MSSAVDDQVGLHGGCHSVRGDGHPGVIPWLGVPGDLNQAPILIVNECGSQAEPAGA
jgi:hypothetical protein